MNQTLSNSATGQEEIVTGTLPPERILPQMREAARLLHSAGIEKVLVGYGWGCNLNPADLWQSVEVDLTRLDQFAADAERTGIYRAGSADLIVADASASFQLLFCHEADIHFKTGDSALLLRMKELWEGQGITVMRKVATGEWTPA